MCEVPNGVEKPDYISQEKWDSFFPGIDREDYQRPTAPPEGMPPYLKGRPVLPETSYGERRLTRNFADPWEEDTFPKASDERYRQIAEGARDIGSSVFDPDFIATLDQIASDREASIRYYEEMTGLNLENAPLTTIINPFVVLRFP